MESAASGLLAGIGAAFRARGEEPPRAAGGHRAGRARPLHRAQRPRALPADQHRVRPAARACRMRIRDKAQRRLALSERALAQPRARSRPASPRARAPAAGGVKRAIAAFVRHLDRERNASAHTARAYGKDLEQFLAHARAVLGREPTPADVDHLLIRSFLARLHERGLEEVVGGAQARRPAHVLPLPVPRGRARAQPGARACSRPAPSGASRSTSRRTRSPPSSTSPAKGLAPAAGAGDPGAVLRDRHPLRRARRARRRRTWTRSARMVRVLGKGRKERVVPFGQPARRALRPTCASAAETPSARPTPCS